ncbi:hypothetical protein F5Y17DRAFT_81193 [Xylariaceae sp. FL0594]|nr:hypothetical protein F5Y17DRAFT_81193 [Xylariaceae sp. FL0594]
MQLASFSTQRISGQPSTSAWRRKGGEGEGHVPEQFWIRENGLQVTGMWAFGEMLFALSPLPKSGMWYQKGGPKPAFETRKKEAACIMICPFLCTYAPLLLCHPSRIEPAGPVQGGVKKNTRGRSPHRHPNSGSSRSHTGSSRINNSCVSLLFPSFERSFVHFEDGLFYLTVAMAKMRMRSMFEVPATVARLDRVRSSAVYAVDPDYGTFAGQCGYDISGEWNCAYAFA